MPRSVVTETPPQSLLPTFTAGSAVLPAVKTAASVGAGAASGKEPCADPPPATDPSVLGLALIPPKLVQKILRGEFVDMHELLPDTWRMEDQRDSCCRSTRPKRGLVTDIALWTECYASLVAVLATKHPDKAPQFMCYLRTIVRASRNFARHGVA